MSHERAESPARLPPMPESGPGTVRRGRPGVARHAPGRRGSRRAARWYSRRSHATQPQPDDATRVETMNRAAGLIEPVVVMAFGAYLGLVNQGATDTSGWLRVPALLAAFILVAQGILGVQQHRATGVIAMPEEPKDEMQAPSAEVVVREVPSADVDAPGKARHRDVPVQIKVTGAGGETPSVAAGIREKPQTIYIVMGLAVWLGLASLANPAAPKALLVMSLLAAFLLFAEAWQMLRRNG